MNSDPHSTFSENFRMLTYFHCNIVITFPELPENELCVYLSNILVEKCTRPLEVNLCLRNVWGSALTGKVQALSIAKQSLFSKPDSIKSSKQTKSTM